MLAAEGGEEEQSHLRLALHEPGLEDGRRVADLLREIRRGAARAVRRVAGVSSRADVEDRREKLLHASLDGVLLDADQRVLLALLRLPVRLRGGAASRVPGGAAAAVARRRRARRRARRRGRRHRDGRHDVVSRESAFVVRLSITRSIVGFTREDDDGRRRAMADDGRPRARATRADDDAVAELMREDGGSVVGRARRDVTSVASATRQVPSVSIPNLSIVGRGLVVDSQLPNYAIDRSQRRHPGWWDRARGSSRALPSWRPRGS
jgi:hypothetical protein